MRKIHIGSSCASDKKKGRKVMNPEKDGQTQEDGTKARKWENDGKPQTKEHEYYINLPSFGKKGPSKLRQQFNKGMTAFIVIVTCILFFFAMLRMDDISRVLRLVVHILKPVIYGLGIAYLLNPIVKFVDEHLEPFLNKKFPKMKKAAKISRSVGIFLAIVFMLAIIGALFNMLIPELYRSIRDMILTVPSQINEALIHMTALMSGDSALGQIITQALKEATTFLENWMRTDLLNQVNVFMSNLTEGVINVINELLNMLIGIIVSIYVLFSKEKFSMQSKKIIYAMFKPVQANMILHLTIKSNSIFGGFIIGKIIDSAIIGVLCFLGLSVLHMPYTLLVSVIVGVTNVIPFFGPYIGAIPSAILIMLSDPKMGIYFIIFILILQQLDGNVIGPTILGDSTGLSAFWVLFSILLGGGLFGVVGMILGVPTFAVLYYIVNMIVNHQLEKRHLPTETACYDRMSYVDASGNYVHSTENEMCRQAAEQKTEEVKRKDTENKEESKEE